MTSNDIKQEVLNWIADGCDWDKGMMLYSVYGKNKQLAKNIAGKKASQSGKLFYELCKSVGLDYQKLKNGKVIPQFIAERSGTGVKSPGISSVSIVPMKVTTVPERRPEFIEGPETIDTHRIEEYPAIIRRVIAEYTETFQERSKTHRIMCEMPIGNSQALKIKRAELFDMVKYLSSRLELLYDIQEVYKSTGFIPEESAIWPPPTEKPKTELPDDVELLKKMKKNQQSANTKDQSMLDYQSEKQGEVKRSMPPGPKRMKLENRIKARLKMIDEIDYKLLKINT